MRRTVSGITSAVNSPPPQAVTVRQTPFTAMLSPTRVPSVTVRAAIRSAVPAARLVMARTVPISSMIPVNIRSFLGISVDQQVGTDLLNGADIERLRVRHFREPGAADGGFCILPA